MTTPTKDRLKSAFLPHGRSVRTLPVGIGRGIRMEIDFAHHTQLYCGLYERELNRYLREAARPGTPCFDVGGADGYTALVLAHLTGAPVCTIERDAASVERLRRNVAANPWADIEVVQCTVAAASDPSNGVSTLDDLAFSRPDAFVPRLLKIDVEGHELAALQGATKLLDTVHPALVVEVHAEVLEERCIELVRGHGYPAPTVVDQRRFLREHRPMVHNRWLVW